MNRRECLQGLIVLLAGCATGGIPKAESPLSPWGTREERSTLMEFAEIYRKSGLPLLSDREQVNILYPGSGSDLSPLEIGLQLLHTSEIERVHFLYTEIGEYEKDLPAWHEGIASLDRQIREGLQQLVRSRVAQNLQRNYQMGTSSIPNSALIEYELDVSVDILKKKKLKKKKLALALSYNNFENRSEPTEEERAALAGPLISGARMNYWPEQREPEKVYPTYFLQEHFDEADIILSKQSGDFGLLQFDYVRAARNTRVRKLRAILTEHADALSAVRESLPQYRTEVTTLKNRQYGYCRGEKDCKVGILVIQP